MSAPRTNLDKQAKNHRFSLAGMAVVLCFVALILAGIIYVTADRGNTPRDATNVDAPASSQGNVTAGPTTGDVPSNAPAAGVVAPTPDPANAPAAPSNANN